MAAVDQVRSVLDVTPLLVVVAPARRLVRAFQKARIPPIVVSHGAVEATVTLRIADLANVSISALVRILTPIRTVEIVTDASIRVLTRIVVGRLADGADVAKFTRGFAGPLVSGVPEEADF